jgi:hydrogenase maturation factor
VKKTKILLKKRFVKLKTNIMPPTIQSIVAAAQALAAQIVAYAATVVTTGFVPANVASALAAVTAASNTLTADLATNTFTAGSPSPATLVTDVANLLAAVNTLSTAIGAPSNP